MNPLKLAEFQLELELDTLEEAGILYRSIKPEISSAPSSRTSSTIKLKGKKVILGVKAQDSTSLRAAVNSYLRWIILSHEVIKI